MRTKTVHVVVYLIIIALNVSCFNDDYETFLKDQFDIDLNDSSYSVTEYRNQWDYNGDGFNLLILNASPPFKNLILKKFNFEKKSELSDFPVNSIPSKYLSKNNLYY